MAAPSNCWGLLGAGPVLRQGKYPPGGDRGARQFPGLDGQASDTRDQGGGSPKCAASIPTVREPGSSRVAGAGSVTTIAPLATVQIREASPSELAGWDTLVRGFANH